jgi:Icc-related predicted phosphoesterase
VRKDLRVRILVVSDLHYRLPHYDWLVEAAGQVDAVAIVGDLADVVSPVPHEVQTVVISTYLGRLSERTRVLAASGNHDLDGPGRHGEQTAAWLRALAAPGLQDGRLHVDGASIDVNDTRFTVCPWWDGPATRDEVGAQLAAAAVDRPARWVWLYHAPPAGTPLCHDGRRTFPDHDLADWIAEHCPDIVLCGHIHQSPWADGGSWHARLGDTWVFNAGRQIGKVPAHITLDTEAGTVDWFGVFESELLTLG